MIRKKQILLFVYDGFHDDEISGALRSINLTCQFMVRTISIDKGVKRSASGLTVLPDLDFIPEVDLKDIDAFNTAMLILPGGNMQDEKTKYKISILAAHCFSEGIPAVTSGDVMRQLSHLQTDDMTIYENKIECSHFIFDKLNLQHDNVLSDLQYEGIMFG